MSLGQTEPVNGSDPAGDRPASPETGRGRLRVYLGAAPGVGKTMAMLDEGNRRLARGTDVVIGLLETHRRPRTESAIGDLPVIPRREISYRGTIQTEMDTDAILARKPELVLVDELAHSNVPGSRHDKRWRDIEDLLDAGIDVLSTVNIQHLESVNDVVTKVTGVVQRETVPDAVVRQADQIHLVDQTPEALRRRMAHGNIYAADKVDAALSNYFRVGNLTALRELALLWVADRVEEGLQRDRDEHEIAAGWETRERLVVAVAGLPTDPDLVRRAARIASRSGGAELAAVHITGGDGLLGADPESLIRLRTLVESLGGTYHVVRGSDPARTLVDFARASNATQLVMGASRRTPWRRRLMGLGTAARLLRIAGGIDVHIVPHEQKGPQLRRRPQLSFNLRRSARGLTLAAVLLTGVTIGLTNSRGVFNLVSDMLLYLTASIVVALVGGLIVAVATALAASALLNYYFTPPLYRFTINDHNNALALAVFLVVSVIVAVLVDRAERRRRVAGRATREAHTLATVAGSVLRGSSALDDLLGQLREIFSLSSVALLEGNDGHWRIARADGSQPPHTPDEADTVINADDRTVLALRGPLLTGDDQRILRAFASQAATALRTERLAEQAEQTEPLRELDRTRTALLAAVSHDLRTPLAGAKAAVSSLRDSSVTFTADDTRELLATADESLDRLARLIANLLDMSRLQAGAMAVHCVPVDADDVIATALDAVGPSGAKVAVNIPAEVPALMADPGLLERVLGNLLENALRLSPETAPPTLSVSEHRNTVEIRVIDHGPGLSAEAIPAAFTAFQRLGDSSHDGVGLGLALARGFTEAMTGTLSAEQTPGGGLTFVIALSAAVLPHTQELQQ